MLKRMKKYGEISIMKIKIASEKEMRGKECEFCPMQKGYVKYLKHKQLEESKMRIIHEYIKAKVNGKNKQKVGIIVGTIVDNIIAIGWSKVNIKAGDEFDKEVGTQIAFNRALGVTASPNMPPQMRDQMREFKIRCLRYFKQAEEISMTGSHLEKLRDIARIDSPTWGDFSYSHKSADKITIRV